MTALMDALQGAIDIDTNIFLFINGMHNTFFDYFMSAYSGKWVWVPMYAAIWYVMLRNFHWKVTLCCMVGLALVIADLLFTCLLGSALSGRSHRGNIGWIDCRIHCISPFPESQRV